MLTPLRGAVLALVVLVLGFGMSRFAEAVLHGTEEAAEKPVEAAGSVAPVSAPPSVSLPPLRKSAPDEPARKEGGSEGGRDVVEEGLPTPEAAAAPATRSGEEPSAPGPRASKEQNRLEALRAVEEGGALEIRLVASRRLEGFQHLYLENPRRFVVDVPGSWSRKLPSDLALSHALAESVRLGLRADGLRVVVDLKGRAGPNPQARVTSEGLAIRLEPGSLRPLPP